MGGMLVDSKNDCCCPEMRCCTPETVTVTVAGMAGNVWSGVWSSKYFDCDGDCQDYIQSCGGSTIPLADVLVLMGKPTGDFDSVFSGVGYPSYCSQPFLTPVFSNFELWAPSLFPPTTPLFAPKTNPGATPQSFCSVSTAGNILTFLANNQVIATYRENTSLCDPDASPPGHPKFCSRPASGSVQSGPVGGTAITNQEDLNGTYVCHRPEQYLRPQLKCRINRQVPLVDSPYDGVTEARLLYNVDPRREWFYRNENMPAPNKCWDVLFPPEGDDYVVDYRCDKRNPWYSSSGFGYCARGKCTVTNQGVVKPHLYYYHQTLNQSANLYLKLTPRDYENDPNGRFPTWWRVESVVVLNGGSGYSVGDFFEVDFDIRRPWLGGEIMTVFPKFDMSCIPPYSPTWVDKYGYGGTDVTLPNGIPAARLYQRLRISEVDDNGAIKSLEVVPIFKQPEFSDPPFCNDAKVGDERTKFYVGYGRVLCHPRSVHMPGRGYTVGDTIEWYCDDPPCEVVRAATAVVTDVDEEGGVLDWLIKGSDAWRYLTQNFCVYPFSSVNGICTTDCQSYPWGGDVLPENDERGLYRWKAKLLCNLNWSGVGVPVRKATRPAIGYGDLFYRQPCSGSNQSGYTNVNVQISRVSSETSIEVYVARWTFSYYENASGGADRAKWLFPAFPLCAGGGAVIRPVFGEWGSNESDFGGSLAGAEIKAAGAGYCYRDKYHTQPTLPTAIPALGSGSGATVAAFTFGSVHNFPNPAIDWGGNAPASNRFSYYPVTGATIGQAGSGYQVGQTFEVAPVGGRAVSDMWRETGGDTPEACPNGAWYDGERATVNAAGYLSILYNNVNGTYGEARSQRPSKCTLRVAAVNETGGITELEVVYGGMMFRTVYGDGKKNPDAILFWQSTLGYGANLEAVFDENHSSTTFGRLLSVSVVAPPSGSIDPKHPGIPDNSGGWVMPPQTMPTGGRDYADQSAGYFWMLNDIAVGGPVVSEQGQWRLMAHIGWHGRGVVGGFVMAPGSEPFSPRNISHEPYSTHNVIMGQTPQFVPRSTVCAFDDCYHSLLTRTYPLVKVWAPGGVPFGDPDSNLSYLDGYPATGYALLVNKNATLVGDSSSFVVPCGFNEPMCGPDTIYAERFNPGSAYLVLEYGPTLTLGYTPSSPCPDHSNGTTTRE